MRRKIVPVFDLSLLIKIPEDIKKIESMKNVFYVHRANKAFVNMVARMMGDCMHPNKSMPYWRLLYHLKNKKRLLLTPIGPNCVQTKRGRTSYGSTEPEDNKEIKHFSGKNVVAMV